jgi:hypothetical protein
MCQPLWLSDDYNCCLIETASVLVTQIVLYVVLCACVSCSDGSFFLLCCVCYVITVTCTVTATSVSESNFSRRNYFKSSVSGDD